MTLHRHNGLFLYKLYFLLPYINPTAKLTPHRKLCAFLDKKQKLFIYYFYALFKPNKTCNLLGLLFILTCLVPFYFLCY